MQQVDLFGARCASLHFLYLCRPPNSHVSLAIEHLDYGVVPRINVHFEYALCARNNSALLSELCEAWLGHKYEDVDSTIGVNVEELNVVMASHALEIENHHFTYLRAR